MIMYNKSPPTRIIFQVYKHNSFIITKFKTACAHNILVAQYLLKIQFIICKVENLKRQNNLILNDNISIFEELLIFQNCNSKLQLKLRSQYWTVILQYSHGPFFSRQHNLSGNYRVWLFLARDNERI